MRYPPGFTGILTMFQHRTVVTYRAGTPSAKPPVAALEFSDMDLVKTGRLVYHQFWDGSEIFKRVCLEDFITVSGATRSTIVWN